MPRGTETGDGKPQKRPLGLMHGSRALARLELIVLAQLQSNSATPVGVWMSPWTVSRHNQTSEFGVSSSSERHQVNPLVDPCPPQITNADFSNCDAVQRLANSWLKTAPHKALISQLKASPLPALPTKPKLTWVASIKQLTSLIDRAVINSVRDPAAYALRYAHFGRVSFDRPFQHEAAVRVTHISLPWSS